MTRLGFWRKCRVCFRWLRISTLLVVLAALCAIVWFNQIGLPDFLKTRLVSALRERGVDLEFTRLRLRFGSGIVAENVRLGDVQMTSGPALTLAEIQLRFDFPALLRRELKVEGLGLREGKLTWPISPTNVLKLENIRTELRFQTNDTWSLDNFTADFSGAKLILSGEIAHAPELRDWEIFRGGPTASQRTRQAQLEKFSDVLRQIHFDGAPLVNLSINGDARDLHSFDLRLKVAAPAVQTPWFAARDLQFAANLKDAAGASTGHDPAWGFWTNAQPYQLAWSARFAQLESEKLAVDSMTAEGNWNAPELRLNNLSITLGGGRLDAGASLNVATRELTFTNSGGFDPLACARLLPEKMRAQLAEFKFNELPRWAVDGRLILPPWTDVQPDWNRAVRPTVQLNARLALTNFSVRHSQIDAAHANFSCSKLAWQFTELGLAQGKTRLGISGRIDEATKQFHAQVTGTFDPETARPWLTNSDAAGGLALVQLTEPLVFDVTAGGSLTNFYQLAVQGNLALTNFAVRAERYGDLTARVDYTNGVLMFLSPLMHTGAQTATADSVTLDFNQWRIFFTNGLVTALPELVVHAIGPKTTRLVAPYRFFEPPTVRVNGQIPLGDMRGGPEMATVDMTFDIIKGAPFQWESLKTTNITGRVHWRGQTLGLANVVADYCGGTAAGHAFFNFKVPHEGADYDFAVNLTNVDLHALGVDLWSPTNQLEGTLAGSLSVTNASTLSVQSWLGTGYANLRDGLLWDIPIFGIISPVLNTVTPGLGSSRATEAAGKFTMTNGVIYTDSLLIRSTMARLEYIGTIDLQQNVEARVTAQLLRDTWVVGPLVSTVLWPVSKLFEYRVTGQLNHPKSEPIYVLPKLLLMPLHPFRTLEEIIPGGNPP